MLNHEEIKKDPQSIRKLNLSKINITVRNKFSIEKRLEKNWEK